MKKRFKAVVSCLMVSALLLSACGQGTQQQTASQPAASSSAASVADSAPSGGGEASSSEPEQVPVDTERTELVVSAGSRFTSGNFDPIGGFLVQGFFLLHSSLLRYNEKLEFENDLAEGDYEVSEDGLEYTFHIREDAYFSDGTPLTASDVAFTYTQFKDAGTDIDVSNMDHAEVIDDHTVRFVLSEPQSSFLSQVALIGIVPEASYDEDYPMKGIGSGPWKVVQCDIEQQTIVEPNEYYYGEKPYFTKVTFLNLDEQAAIAAVKSGDLDLCMVGIEYAIEEVEGMHLERIETVDSRVLTLPVVPETTNEEGQVIGNNVTSDIAIRQALNIGISREQIIADVYNGIGRPAYGWASSWGLHEPFADGQKEEAIRILEDAGWTDSDGDGIREKDGVTAEFDIYSMAVQMERYYVSLAIADQAEALGIRINCYAEASDVIRENKMSSGVIYSFGEYSVQQLKSWYYTGTRMNCTSLSIPEVDAEIEAAINAISQEEALDHWQKAQEIAQEEIPYLFLVNVEHCLFVRDGLNLGTVIPNPHGHGAPAVGRMNEWHWEN